MSASLALSLSKQLEDVAGKAGHRAAGPEEGDVRTRLLLARAQTLPPRQQTGNEQALLGPED